MLVLTLIAAVLAATQVTAQVGPAVPPRVEPGVAASGQTDASSRRSVSGRLRTYNGKPLLSAAVIIGPQQAASPDSAPGEATIRPDGAFTFRDVAPGHYVIRARGETDRNGVSLFATFSVAVQARDISGITLTLAPGASIEGRVEISPVRGNSAPAFTALRVRAPLADGAAFGDTLTGAVQRDGTFRLAGLMPGTHVLMVEGLTFPWRIAEARVHGLDAVENAIEIEGAEDIRHARVVLSDTAAAVVGTIALPSAVDRAATLVVAFPADPLKRRLPLRYVRVGRISGDGAFRIVDLVPGNYLVAVSADLTEADVMRPDVLDRLAADATAVSLAGGQIATVTPVFRLPSPAAIP